MTRLRVGGPKALQQLAAARRRLGRMEGGGLPHPTLRACVAGAGASRRDPFTL